MITLSIPFGFVLDEAAGWTSLIALLVQAALWRDVTVEYLQFDGTNGLRKTSIDPTEHFRNSMNVSRRWSMRENDRVLDEIAQRQQNLRKTIKAIRKDEPAFCLHDRLMSEIKQQRILKPIGNSICSRVQFDFLVFLLV